MKLTYLSALGLILLSTSVMAQNSNPDKAPNAMTGNCDVGTMPIFQSGALTCRSVSNFTNYSANVSSAKSGAFGSVGIKAPTLSDTAFRAKFTKRSSISGGDHSVLYPTPKFYPKLTELGPVSTVSTTTQTSTSDTPAGQ